MAVQINKLFRCNSLIRKVFIKEPRFNLSSVSHNQFNFRSVCATQLSPPSFPLQVCPLRGFRTCRDDWAKSEQSDEELHGDKMLNVKLKAQRLDAVLKSGLGLSRNKVEKAVYEDRVRVNGLRPEKKSQIVYEGDEVDLVRGYNELNPDKFIDVARVEIVKLKDPDKDDEDGSDSDADEDSRIPAVLRRSKMLTIRNYSPPWKGSSQN